ncbi:MAG: hypothetical protein J6386_03730 [Candidatus Synoicihabitans palmerolidicus]|nr:hypothetical protein [Candidatus Synoicihabitans palmerolidicus]
MDRPTILTEYAHALGLATDRIQEEWEIIQTSECLVGGAIWHFMDQGILRRSEPGIRQDETTRYVWLDGLTYYDTSGVDGADGLVYADRRPQTDFWLTRKVYAPVQIRESVIEVTAQTTAVTVTLENRHDFVSLVGKTLRWSLQRNGQAVNDGVVALHALSHEKEQVLIPVAWPQQDPRDVWLLALDVCDEAGASISDRHVRLRTRDSDLAGWVQTLPTTEEWRVSETASLIEVSSLAMEVTVDRQTGQLRVRDAEGRAVIEGIDPRTARQLTMAEARNAKSRIVDDALPEPNRGPPGRDRAPSRRHSP